MSPSKHDTAEKDGKEYVSETEGLGVIVPALKYIGLLSWFSAGAQVPSDLAEKKEVKYCKNSSAYCNGVGNALMGTQLAINMYQDGGVGKECVKTSNVIACSRAGAYLGCRIGTAVCDPVYGAVFGTFLGGCIGSFCAEKVNRKFSADNDEMPPKSSGPDT